MKPSLGRIILTHLIVGPPAGGVAFIAFMSSYELLSGGRPFDLQGLIVGLPLIFAFAYILGSLPAIITGLLSALLWSKTERAVLRVGAAPLIGALSSLVALFWIIFGPNSGIPKWVVVTNFATTGAVAALVSALLLERWARRRTTRPTAP